jgi:branched-subunit amino acid transport protein AzlD
MLFWRRVPFQIFPSRKAEKGMSKFGAFWGLAGVMLLLGSAVYRLAPLAIDAFSFQWFWYHWSVFALVLFFMAYAEGYRAFHLAFSPRVAARARYLLGHSNILHTVFAPLFCMAYFHAPRRRRITSLSVTAGIIVLVILVRLLPQPWRGIIDGGVLVGLAWGLISLAIFGYQALTAATFSYDPEVPEKG